MEQARIHKVSVSVTNFSHQLSEKSGEREAAKERNFPLFLRKQALRESYRFWGGCLQQIHKTLLRVPNWAKHLIDEKEYKMHLLDVLSAYIL